MIEIEIEGVKHQGVIHNQYANWEEVCEQLRKENQEEK